MSSSILSFVQIQITRYGTPIILVLGNIGNIFIVIMFSRRRQSSCAMYILWTAVINSINMTFNILISLYGLYYGNPTGYSIVLCKIRYYVFQTWCLIAGYLTVLSCIDRFLLTINNVRFRLMNRPSTALYIIGIMFIFWHIISIHILVFVTINNRLCTLTGTYYIIYFVYIGIFLCIFPPILMIIFGFLAYRNMKRLHTRIRPTVNNMNDNRNDITIHRQDRELFTMVLADAIVYVVTMFVYPFIILEIAVSNYMGISKSSERIQIENLLSTIGVMLLYLNCATSFYTYFVSSKPFRRDFRKIFIKCKCYTTDNNNTIDI